MESRTPVRDAVRRTAIIGALIPGPSPDVTPLRLAFSRMVSNQWDAYTHAREVSGRGAISDVQWAKVRFLVEMYSRACYSMLMVCASGPKSLRLPIRVTTVLPLSRALAIRLGCALLNGMDWLVSKAVHRQLILMSTLMGVLDLVLDDIACYGEPAVLRIASLMTGNVPETSTPAEQYVAALVRSIRGSESLWQSKYWESILEPSVRSYCLAECRAAAYDADPTGLGHRWAGIEAAIKGMWYVIGPEIGLAKSRLSFDRTEWSPEQKWMADTSLLMQMIDDWVDQEVDRGTRLTPVASGDWGPETVDRLYHETVDNLTAMLNRSGIPNAVMQELFVDLYNDYLHSALDGMRDGVGA